MRTKNFKVNCIIIQIVALVLIIPTQVMVCMASELPVEVITLSPKTKKESVVKEEKEAIRSKEATVESSSDSGDSTLMWVGIGAGAAAVIVGAVAISGGGGGSDPVPIVPPTADSLVGAWHGEGHQPGSGHTYTATYTLYSGGSIGYDIYNSEGEHLVGGGSWRISEYHLEIKTDHGSLYKGDFLPAETYVTIDMSSSNGWNLTLTR